MIAQQPAIYAWQANDGGVTLVNVDVPNDGRFIVGAKATSFGSNTGHWRYEYAVYNMNCDRSAGAFNLPVPGSADIRNIGFHDVDYHSGEPYALTDWTETRTSATLSWATAAFASDANANALRWGTLYNFRFDADAPPKVAYASIALFKPGTPASVNVRIIAPTMCAADIAPDGVGNGIVDIDDLLTVIFAWGPCANPHNCPADIAPPGGDDVVSVYDLLAVIEGWGRCP